MRDLNFQLTYGAKPKALQINNDDGQSKNLTIPQECVLC